MLELKNQANFLASEMSPLATDEPSAAELFTNALGIVRRQIFVVLFFASVGAALGGIFFLKNSPKFTATATLLINTRKIEIFQQPAVADEMSMQTSGAVESQVELLRSDDVAVRVIRKLNLSGDPRFIQGKSFVGRLLSRLSPWSHSKTPAPSQDERQSAALRLFDQSLTVQRLGATYAIQIAFQSEYPDLAAEVANAVAGAYIDLQRELGI